MFFTRSLLVKKKVLFLTNNDNAFELYDWLIKREVVVLFQEKLDIDAVKSVKPDIIISYNYKYMISEEVIQYMDGNVLNLHISYLPWNRGSAPNFWSFIDNTPKGVTIHYIDKGLDTGNIIFQKEVFFDEMKESFASSYMLLHKELIMLFKLHWEELKYGRVTSFKQDNMGTYHSLKEFNRFLGGKKIDWNVNIYEFKKIIRGEKNE